MYLIILHLWVDYVITKDKGSVLYSVCGQLLYILLCHHTSKQKCNCLSCVYLKGAFSVALAVYPDTALSFKIGHIFPARKSISSWICDIAHKPLAIVAPALSLHKLLLSETANLSRPLTKIWLMGKIFDNTSVIVGQLLSWQHRKVSTQYTVYILFRVLLIKVQWGLFGSKASSGMFTTKVSGLCHSR